MMAMRKYNWEILEMGNFEIYFFDYLAPNLLSAVAASFKLGSSVNDL